MRIIFLLVVIVLMQAFTFGLGRSLQWLFADFFNKAQRRWLMIAAYVVSNLLLLGVVFRVSHGIFRIAATWLVLMLFVMYAALATFLLYLLLCRVLNAKPMARSLRIFAPLFLIALLVVGSYNAYTPVVRHAEITLDKPLVKPVRIALASDTHFGILFGARQIDKLVDIVNREQADVVLLAGDVMDDNTDYYRSENMQPHLEKLRAPLGVYATMGNHDLFGHQAEIDAELTKAGVRVLNDEAIELEQGFTIVGRLDDLDKQRKTTTELLQKVDTTKPVILVDHRPSQIEKHSQLPIDVQVSGHTHNGQIMPANLIVRYLNRLAYGYEHIGNGHFFVTSGYGFWGVPFRLGSQAELWVIDLVGKKS